MAGGRRQEALAKLDRASELGDPDAAEARAWLAALPFGAVAPGERDAVRAAVVAPGPSSLPDSPRPSSFFSAQNRVHPLVRIYLAGLLSANPGEAWDATQDMTGWEAMAETEGERALARQLAPGLRARDLLQARDSAGALEVLSRLVIEAWYEHTFVSPYWSGALERFTRAELLLAAGRPEEALGWYQGLGENSVSELAFLGPSLLREAAIHQAADRDLQAREARARFNRLWAGADADFRTEVVGRYGADLP